MSAKKPLKDIKIFTPYSIPFRKWGFKIKERTVTLQIISPPAIVSFRPTSAHSDRRDLWLIAQQVAPLLQTATGTLSTTAAEVPHLLAPPRLGEVRRGACLGWTVTSAPPESEHATASDLTSRWRPEVSGVHDDERRHCRWGPRAETWRKHEKLQFRIHHKRWKQQITRTHVTQLSN